jgi:hypothetical protein
VPHVLELPGFLMAHAHPRVRSLFSPVVLNSEIIQPCVLCGLCLLMSPVHGGFEASKYCTS